MDQVNQNLATATSACVAEVTNQWAFPLSLSQQRLWLLDQLEPGNTSYSIPWSIRLTGVLHVNALARSLNEIVRRHESLRTTFKSEAGAPFQLVNESLAVPLPLTDLTFFKGDRHTEARRIAKEEARRPMDLTDGPLIRVQLTRLDEREHVLLITLHHIVFDGWSRRIFARELAVLYQAFRDDQPSPLPELALQYADHVVWQRNSLNGKPLQRKLAYWKRQLAGVPAHLNLPTDNPRPAVQSYRGSAKLVDFNAAQYEALLDFAREHEVSLFMLLLAGFQALLSRYSGDEDILVGTPIANRTRAQTEDLIGLFANTLVLRGDLTGDPTFSELVSRTKQTALDAYANQDVPFDKLVEELNPERSLSHNPLFQVMFSLQNAARQAFELSDLVIEPLESKVETSKFDISFFLAQTEKGLTGRLEYNTDLFEGKTIERLWGHYRSLLAGAVADASMRLSELPLLSGNERQQLLAGWNETAVEYERSLCLHEWFERQVAERPSALACIWDEGALSYAELNERANQLAHCLRRQGAKPGERVGVFLERSAQLLVALLGIQKSGAAYVPVDPAYPAERIRQIWEQAQIKVLVTEAGIADSLALGAACVRILLDTERSALERESGENLTPSAKAGDAVYVIFTSGSTGRPKGVEVPHRAVVNLLASMAQELRLGPGEVFPALASVAFDMCIPELYLALVTGGTVALGRAGLAADGVELAAFLQRVGATVVHATPTTWRLLLDAGFTGAGLKRAIGAEALPPEVCRRLLAAEPSLYNFYGPTETTVWSTVHHFQSAEEEVVIGRPLANTRIYILDRGQQPVPIGIEGELYIGGAGVANGYLGQPELTAERFLADPFCAGGRMYRTGDRARYRADGRIEYRGRGDLQVKLRGYRIELGEVEAVLTQHGGVAQCVAAVREETPGDQRLVAYVVAQPGSPLPEAALRSWVKERLPEYMVPVRIVEVERFALTPNGKVDRGQLAGVSYQREGAAAESQAARTPLEEVVGGIWAEVLKLERVGMEEDFFQLGGHSLLGTQVVSRIRQAAAVELPLRALFEAPTVRGLAQRVAELRQGGGGRLRPALERLPRPERVPLSLAQQRLWFLDQLEPGNVLYNVPYLVRLSGPLEAAVLEQSLQEIVRRHESLRTRFVLCDDEPAQLIDGAWELKLERVALAPGPAADRLSEARRLVLAQIQQPFHLAQGPLLRASLYELAADDHVFLLNTHHIVSDRWSLGVLAEELAALYAAYREGKPSPLAALPVQYADYALWQRACLTDAVLAPQLAFWKKHLHGAPAFLNLPTDRATARETTFAGAQSSEVLGASLSKRINDFCREENVTLFMTVLAAFSILLQKYSGQQDIVVGTPLAGRGNHQTERLIGFFVNTLALHTSVSPELDFRRLLRNIREAVLDAFANPDLPFDKLIEDLKPEREPGRNPLFQVMLIVQNMGRMAQTIGPAQILPFPVPSGSAKFDLTLIVTETAQGLRFVFEYRTDLFEESTIQRMQGHFTNLLEQVLGEPHTRIANLSLLGREERHAVLTQWNETDQDYPSDASLPDLIRSVVLINGSKTAVVCGNEKLTYGGLDERSNRVANYLRRKGVSSGHKVGLFVTRSVNMITALLGIMKAGGAYVPIDLSFPKDRIAFLLADADVALLVTERSLTELLPPLRIPCVQLDIESSEIYQASAIEPKSADASDLAYLIFTSGSTGKPKGVQVTHGNLVNFLLSMKREPGLNTQDVVLALTSLSFDIAALELYLPLISGATVVIASRDQALDPKKLSILMADARPTLVQATPATWRMLVESGWSGDSGIKALCGGEALTSELASGLLPRCRELWNMYGPTETTVWSSIYKVNSESPRPVPIGRPIANTQFYILDSQLQVVPVGVVGELYIGGTGVARGYYNRSELNDERFVPDPFRKEGRMYRTGDLSKFLPDGNAICLGRTDAQVKIRGHRIELGEIEAAVLDHEGVMACVVIARTDLPGDKQLVAYYVTRATHEVTASSLRSHLRNTLPAYLVPGIYQQLDSLPLTASGKIDRRSLPKPKSSNVESGDLDCPRDDFELVLLQLWRIVLGIECCGIRDNFFELGGHSLLLIRLATMIEKEFGRIVPAALLFDSPTIDKIAAFLRTGNSDASGFFVPFQTKGPGPAFFLVHSVIGDVVGCRHLVRLLDPDQRVYGIQVPLELRTNEFASSVENIAATYVEKLIEFEPQGPYILGGWSAGAPIALEMAQQLKKRGFEVPLIVSVDAAPANTGGGTSRYHPKYWWKLLRTIPMSVQHDFRQDFSWARVFTRAKGRCRKNFRRWSLPKGDEMALAQDRVAAFLANAEYSESAKAFMGALYTTLQGYLPKRYAGKVLLYRARGESFLRLKEVAEKWKKIASDLEVVPIDGNHVSIMLGAQVEAVANDLNRRLAEFRMGRVQPEPPSPSSLEIQTSTDVLTEQSTHVFHS